jgi:Protein of unknown function (DUF3352)
VNHDPLDPVGTPAHTDGGDADITLADVTTTASPVAVKRPKSFLFLAAAAAVALVISVGAYFGYNLVFGGPQPAERMPASAFAYLSVDLSPGLDQTSKLAKLAKKLPQTGSEKSPKAGLEKAFDGLDLKDLDVKRDLSAWLGNRVGVAAWAGGHQQVYGLLALESTDDEAATAGLKRIKDAVKGRFGFTVHDGFALAAFGGEDAQAAADAAAAEAAASPLSESAKYAEARKWLEGDQFAVFYADYDGFSKIADSLGTKEMGGPIATPSGTVIVGVRAEDDGLSARFRTFGGKAKPASPPTDALGKLGALPAGTGIGMVLRLPEDAKAWSSLVGLPYALAFASAGDEFSMDEPQSRLTPAEQEEFDALIEKQMTGKLSKAEQKRFEQLSKKMIGPIGSPKDLTPAEQAELEALIAKPNPTEAEQARMAELLVPGYPAGGPDGLGKEWDETFDALSGGLLSLAVTDVAATPSFRAIVELAKTPDAETMKRLTALSGKNMTVKVDGGTLSLQSDGFTGSGRLADDPLFRRASAGSAAADAQMAVYVDLTRVAPAKARAELGPYQAIFISGGADSGTAKVLIG